MLKYFRIFSRSLKSFNHVLESFTIKKQQKTFCTQSFENILKLESILEKSIFLCKGCGCQIQHNLEQNKGYVNKQKLLEYIQKNEYLNLRRELSTEISEPSELDQIFEQENFFDEPKNQKYIQQSNNDQINIICQRCFDIRNYQKNNQFEISSDYNYSYILKFIFDKIKPRNYAIYLIDILNLSETFDHNVLEQLNKKQSTIILVINKYDILPKQTVESLVRGNIKNFLSKFFPEQTELKLFFVSSKTGEGLINVIEHLKYCFKLHEKQQKKIYIIGSTNSGKSTFINKIVQMQNEYYKQNLQNKNEQMLTTSSFPHTTLDFVKIKHIHLGFPLYDTPGIPFKSQDYIQNYIQKSKNLLITKELTPFVLPMIEKQSVYFGALARIDLIDGNNLDFYIYISQEVNIHKTKSENANFFYLKQYDKILQPVYNQNIQVQTFEKNCIVINCDEKGIAEDELEISGIGVVGFRSNRTFKTLTKIELFLPKFINFNLRKRWLPLPQVESRNKLNKRHIKIQ